MNTNSSDVLNNISKIISNIKFSSVNPNATKEEVIENLNNNILNLEELKRQYTQLYVATASKLLSFDEKLKNAKYEHSKKLYQKKVDRYRDDSIVLLEKMQLVDDSIKNLIETREKLLVNEESQENKIDLVEEKKG